MVDCSSNGSRVRDKVQDRNHEEILEEEENMMITTCLKVTQVTFRTALNICYAWESSYLDTVLKIAIQSKCYPQDLAVIGTEKNLPNPESSKQIV